MLTLKLMCFQAKCYLVLGRSQAKAKDAALTGSNESWRGNPFLRRNNYYSNSQVPFYLNHLPVFCSICYRKGNVGSPRTQKQRWFASPYVIIENFIAKSCLSLNEKTKSNTNSPDIYNSLSLKKIESSFRRKERGKDARKRNFGLLHGKESIRYKETKHLLNSRAAGDRIQ